MPTPSAARALAGVLLLALPAIAQAANPWGHPEGEVLVAVLDTGLDWDHAEFDRAQVVAWWDFASGHALPGPGDTWDPAATEPFDRHGHGTAVASLVAGKTVGVFPGAKLAVARLHAEGDGVLVPDAIVNIAPAIRWAASLGADVVVMSFGSVVADASTLDDVDEAVRLLHDSGGLAVPAAGNGVLNWGVRQPSELTSPSSSPYALVVGATGDRPSFFQASFSNTDPDVVARGVDVCVARAAGTTMARRDITCHGRDAAYGVASGTSFAAPLVAGWAAAAVQAAFDAGRDPAPAETRAAFLGTARNTVSPYVFEGWGVVDDATAAEAARLLAAGEAPPAGAPENVAAAAAAARLRTLWTEQGEVGAGIYVPRGTASANVLGASAPSLRDADLWALDLDAGDRVDLAVAFEGALADVELVVYRPGGHLGVRGDDEVLAAGRRGFGAEERVAFVAPAGGLYTVAVEGYLTSGRVGYTFTAKVDGAAAAPTFLGDHVNVGTRVLA